MTARVRRYRLYHALYGGIAITFAWVWGRATEQSWGQMIARR